VAATASSAFYMRAEERDVIAFVNLARLFPQRFDSFYLDWLENVEEDQDGWEKFQAEDGFYASLHRDLLKMKPLPALQPDLRCFKAARQWAVYSGKKGILGHGRPWYMRKVDAECCDYNPSGDPMSMVLDLLIDEGVRSLGHRRILLGKWLQVGASIQPHTGYEWCLVMDFE
jgi:hypothetical protein